MENPPDTVANNKAAESVETVTPCYHWRRDRYGVMPVRTAARHFLTWLRPWREQGERGWHGPAK